MKLILVCGPWSSGTTAVSGMLEKLGVLGIPPYFRTNDERTKNSYESILFRDCVDKLVSDKTLSVTAKPEEISNQVKLFKEQIIEKYASQESQSKEITFFLKYPLSAFLINEFTSQFNTKLIYVLRPFSSIEKTRLRRSWTKQFGQEGAQVIYSRMFSVMINRLYPTMIIRYDEMIRNPAIAAKKLSEFAGINSNEEQINDALNFIRKS
jgi:hypothetical protein